MPWQQCTQVLNLSCSLPGLAPASWPPWGQWQRPSAAVGGHRGTSQGERGSLLCPCGCRVGTAGLGKANADASNSSTLLWCLCLTPLVPSSRATSSGVAHSHPSVRSLFLLSQHKVSFLHGCGSKWSHSGCLQPGLREGQQPQNHDTGTYCTVQHQRGAKVPWTLAVMHCSPSEAPIHRPGTLHPLLMTWCGAGSPKPGPSWG